MLNRQQAEISSFMTNQSLCQNREKRFSKQNKCKLMKFWILNYSEQKKRNSIFAETERCERSKKNILIFKFTNLQSLITPTLIIT